MSLARRFLTALTVTEYKFSHAAIVVGVFVGFTCAAAALHALNNPSSATMQRRAEQAFKQLEQLDADVRHYWDKFDGADGVSIDLSNWNGRTSDFTYFSDLKYFSDLHCRRVDLLTLGAIDLTDAQMRQLHALQKLGCLDVTNANVSNFAIQELRVALPNVLILEDEDSKQRFLNSKEGMLFRNEPTIK